MVKKRNKALLVTATAFTLGLTGLGATGLVPKPVAVHAADINSILQKKEFYSTADFWKNCLWARGTTITTVKDLKSVPNEVIDVVQFDADNSEFNTETTLKSPIRTFKHTDSVTKTTAREFAFGQELSAEASIGPFSKVSGKFTAGQKLTKTTATLEADETTTQFGGDPITVPAHKHYAINYVFTTTKYTGKFQNIEDLTDSSNFEQVGIWQPVEGNPNGNWAYSNRESSASIGHTTYGLLKAIQNVYNNYKNNTDKPKYIFVEYQNDVYYLKFEDIKKDILDIVEFDDSAKKVYVLQDSAEFKGESGINLTVKPVDVTGGIQRSLPKDVLY